jgi:hypothetical protein
VNLSKTGYSKQIEVLRLYAELVEKKVQSIDFAFIYPSYRRKKRKRKKEVKKIKPIEKILLMFLSYMLSLLIGN